MPTNSGYITDMQIYEGKKGNYATVKIDGYSYKLFENKLDDDDSLGLYQVDDYVKVKWFESTYEVKGETRKSRVINSIEKMEPDSKALNARERTPENPQGGSELSEVKEKLNSIEHFVSKDYEENQHTIQHLMEAIANLNRKIDKIAEHLDVPNDQFQHASQTH